MARKARNESIDPHQVQIVHCVNRCVRRIFLCGQDRYSGNNYEHRRAWFAERMKWLCQFMALDVLTYSIMSNHFHVVLRSRCDIVDALTDREIAVRWLKLCPPRKLPDGSPAQPNEFEINSIVNDPQRLAEIKLRLSDVSWLMKFVAEHIARKINHEENASGRVWEGRFKATQLLDEAALLACSMYVDLNPIRAAIAESPETSQHTGVKDRIDDFGNLLVNETAELIHQAERSGTAKNAWLSPLEIDERNDPVGPDISKSGRRASDKGFLSMPLGLYVEILDWTGRQIHAGKRGLIPSHLRPIIERLGLRSESWVELVKGFGKSFKRAAGCSSSLKQEAKRRGQTRLQAPGLCFYSDG